MSETILLALLEWSIRTTILAGAVGVLLWAARVKNAQVRLTAWTIVLVTALLMPFAAPLAPRLSIPVPRFFAQKDNRKPQTHPAFDLPSVPHSNAGARKPYYPGASDIAAISWLLIALTMLFRLLLGLRLSARLVRGSRRIEDNIRESDLVRVPITVVPGSLTDEQINMMA